MALSGNNRETKSDITIQRRTDLLFNKIDGEVIMLSIENGEYYGMDKVGSRIWDLIEKKIKLEDLILILMDDFEVTKEQCYFDTLTFLNELKAKKLIEFC